MKDDDYWRKHMMRDPFKAMIHQDHYANGCNACVRNIQDKKTLRWKCEIGLPGHPDMTKDDCTEFMRKSKKR